MSNCIIGGLNWIWEGSPTFSGGDWSLSLDALKDWETKNYARTASLDPEDMVATISFPASRLVDTILLGYANASDDGEFRIMAGGPPLDVDYTAQAAGVVPTGWTYTRASDGSYWDAAGVLQIATTNAPRYDHDPLTLAPLGYLSERASTQLLVDPEALGSWTLSGATVSSNSAAAPTGGTTADRIVEATGTTAHGITQARTFSSSTSYIYSGHFKAQQRSWLVLRIADGIGSIYAFFNLGTGAVGHVTSGVNNVAQIQALPGGYYRCSLAFRTAVGAGAGTVGIFLATGDGTDSTPSYAGNTSNGLLGWGLRMEAGGSGSHPTSYLAGNRSADSMTLAGDDFTDALGSAAALTLGVEFSYPNSRPDSGVPVLAATEGVGNETITLSGSFDDSSLRMVVVAGGVAQARLSLASALAGDGVAMVLVGTSSSNRARVAADGDLSSLDSTVTAPAVDRLVVGGGDLPTHIRRVCAAAGSFDDAGLTASSLDLDDFADAAPAVVPWAKIVPTTHTPVGGYLPFGRPGTGQQPTDERDPRGASRLVILDEAVEIDGCTIQFRDPTNADGFFQFSILWMGKSERPEFGVESGGMSIGPVEESRRKRSLGGSFFGRSLWKRMRVVGAMRKEGQGSALATWLELQKKVGATRPILFSLYPDDAGIHQDRLTVLGVLEEPSPVEHEVYVIWGWPFAIVAL